MVQNGKYSTNEETEQGVLQGSFQQHESVPFVSHIAMGHIVISVY